MEKITKKKEQTYEYTLYVAADGTEFNNETECQKYEESAACVLLARLSNVALLNTDNSQKVDPVMDDSSDNEYKCIVPETPEDIANLNQLWYMYGGRYKKSSGETMFFPEDIGTPILLGYRFCDNEIEWVWFYKLTEVINKATFGHFRVAKA